MASEVVFSYVEMQEYVVLVPLSDRWSRVERRNGDSIENAHYIAEGEHRGIVVLNKSDAKILENEDMCLSFTVFLVNNATEQKSREKRVLRFWFSEAVEGDRHSIAQEFFKELLQSHLFPKDYAGFLKRILKLMQGSYLEIDKVEIEMLSVKEQKEDEDFPAPPVERHVYESTIYEMTQHGVALDEQHIRRALEDAYPAALSPALIADSLQCPEDEVRGHLGQLEHQGLVMNLQGDEDTEGLWVLSTKEMEEHAKASVHSDKDKGGQFHRPTIAIITALFSEKVAVDSIIDNPATFVRYKTGGDQSHHVYTLGEICGHSVVCTKLSAVGHDRQSRTAAGSLTTRLLGGFQSVNHVIIVGVGGGVPHYTDAGRHVKLGDVVVSVPSGPENASYLYCEKIQKRRSNDAVEQYVVKSWRPVSDELAQAAKALHTAIGPDGPLPATEDRGSGDEAVPPRPPASSDCLYMWVGEGGVVEVNHPEPARDESRLHLGPVGSGRLVVRDAGHRSDFAQRFGLRAYDAEFDAVVDSVVGNRIESWAVVRGIADYIDGPRNQEWQAYAAHQAAIVVRELIGRL